MNRCPRCEEEGSLESWTAEESEYGYGGYTGNRVITGVEVSCRACQFETHLGLCELSDMAIEYVSREDD